MTTIEFKDVNFGYSEDRLVLRDINLTISEPGLYCIIGPNGVGKSTIAKCISRIIEPVSGTILLDGKDLKEYTLKDVAKQVAFVPAHQADVFSMSVVDTILVGRYNHNRWGSHKNDMKN
ncbi:MAG: ABC transporter ATP-binding protein, partial [archaeon]|nr:ABC transporter ATP-binding protein [archaeon]